jgi:hypothetical protein
VIISGRSRSASDEEGGLAISERRITRLEAASAGLMMELVTVGGGTGL